MEKLFETNFTELFFNRQTSNFLMIWKETTDLMKDEDFKQDTLKYVSYYHLNPKGVLHNMLLNKFALSPALQEWANLNINKAALKVGLTKVAILLPVDVFSMISVQQTMEEELGLQLSTAFFQSEGDAWKWLEQK